MSDIICGHTTKYLVNLTEDERTQLEALIATGTGQARVLTRARILLAADRDDTDAAISYALHVHPTTVAAVSLPGCRTPPRQIPPPSTTRRGTASGSTALGGGEEVMHQ